MATINLPPVEPKGQKTSEEYLYHVANILAMTVEQLQNALEGRLDVKNLRASSITADRLNVDQLSAISADLGKVVAGILIGAYISTADGTYPRIDFSSDDNLLKAMLTATNYIGILPDISGNPSIDFNNGTQRFLQTIILDTLILNNVSGAGNIQLNAQFGDIMLSCGVGKQVKIEDWTKFYSTNDTKTLQQELDSLRNEINNLKDKAFTNARRSGSDIIFDSENDSNVDSVSITP